MINVDKSTQELAFVYMADGHPKTNKDKALSLFEKISSYALPQIYIGLLYYNGTETKRDKSKGKSYVESGIKILEEKNGINHLGSYDLLQIAWMYQDESEISKAKEFYRKTIAKSDLEGFYDIKAKAEELLRTLG